MKKIKYAAMTTVEGSIKSFMLPVLDEMDPARYEISLICNMSDDFKAAYQERYNCIPVGLKRGFSLGTTLKAIWQLYRLFRTEKFDIIEYGTENAAFCASMAAAFAHVPVRIYDHWGARFVGYTGSARLVAKVIEKIAAFFSTDIRQVSPKNMEMCISEHIYPRRKVKVLGKGGTVGVDFERFDIKRKDQYRKEVQKLCFIDNETTVFGFIGRIQADKGVNELIEAFKQLLSEEGKIALLLVGPIDEMNAIDAENMAWAQNSESVVFAGHVSDPQRYMSAFDIMTHPTYREGFGMVLQEAAALKVPIITTDIIGPGEFIQNGKTGILVPPKDAMGLYRAMNELLHDKEKRNQLAEEGYQYTKLFFERSVMVQRMIDDREKLIQDRLRHR